VLRLHLHPRNSVHHENAAVEHAHAALNLQSRVTRNTSRVTDHKPGNSCLNSEVNVAWGIDKVDVMLPPLHTE
jgi:hypothetical protein